MTAIATPAMTTTTTRTHNPILRIARLHAVNPSVLFGIPWLILGAAWAISMTVTLILHISGIGTHLTDFRSSWAVLAPQWYLVAAGVQAVSFTFPFALGFGATRRDFWLGTALIFTLVAFEMSIAIATLVQLEIATHGWGVNAGMFTSLWYGHDGWLFDFYSTFCLEMLVLFIGATITAIYMRWRMRGMLVFSLSAAVVILVVVGWLTYNSSWPAVFGWFASIGLTGSFTLVLALAMVCAGAGYLVIRRATPR